MADDSGQRSSNRWQYEEGANPPPKLRSTCDRCMMLKVRCDKKKPQCERCEAFQVPCVYSPYRWKGKLSAHNQPSSKKVVESSHGGSSSTILSKSQEETREHVAQSAGIFSFEAQNFVSKYSDIMTGFDKDSTLSGNNTDDLEGLYAQCISVDQPQGIRPAHVRADDPIILDAFGASDTSMSEEGSDFSSRGETPMCSCPSLAFTTLQDMFRAEPHCRGDTVIPGLTRGDHIVKINRTTMQRLERLLSCAKETCT